MMGCWLVWYIVKKCVREEAEEVHIAIKDRLERLKILYFQMVKRLCGQSRQCDSGSKFRIWSRSHRTSRFSRFSRRCIEFCV